jgi:hypothetical protein
MHIERFVLDSTGFQSLNPLRLGDHLAVAVDYRGIVGEIPVEKVAVPLPELLLPSLVEAS